MKIYKHIWKNHIQYYFWCPGCDTPHALNDTWQFNQDYDSPTFHPSILVTSPNKDKDNRCHSFIENGNIRFLDDCHHGMKGQTVPLPAIEHKELCGFKKV